MTRKGCLTAAVGALVMVQAATAQAAAAYQPGPKAKKGPKVFADFARWDQNGDGVIDHAEFQQAVEKVHRFEGRERGPRGPEARQRGQHDPEAIRGHRGRQAQRGQRGPAARRDRGPGGKMRDRIEALVRRVVKEMLRDMHEAHGPWHGAGDEFHGFDPNEPMHGPMRHGMHRGRGLDGPRDHAGFGGPPADRPRGGPAMGPMRGGPRDGGCPACGCQCGGKGRPKGALRDGPKRGRGGEGRGEIRKPGRKGGRGKGPEARERGSRGRKGDGPPPRWMEMFKRQDANGDGVVSADEFMGPPDRFEMLDANDDGGVDRRELEKAMKRGGKEGRGKEGRGRKPHGERRR
jgi:hypothetical protein